MQPHEVLEFWFDELSPQVHFSKDLALDEAIRKRFCVTMEQAARCELFGWRVTPQGRLAEILVLDQFSRNIFRDSARAFDQDHLALALAQELVGGGHDKALPLNQRSFAYMPFMHSESSLIHEQAVVLFSQTGLENFLNFEQQHKVIIDRFGRYPHRNALLDRESTPEELVFLKDSRNYF